MNLYWSDQFADFVAARVPQCQRGFGECQALGVVEDDKIIGALVFHNWVPENGTIEVSGAADSPRWYSRAVIEAATDYVFRRLGCQMMIARQRRDNIKARKCWLALGADEVRIPRMYGREADGTVITLTEEQWQESKFRRPHHGAG